MDKGKKQADFDRPELKIFLSVYLFIAFIDFKFITDYAVFPKKEAGTDKYKLHYSTYAEWEAFLEKQVEKNEYYFLSKLL